MFEFKIMFKIFLVFKSYLMLYGEGRVQTEYIIPY